MKITPSLPAFAAVSPRRRAAVIVVGVIMLSILTVMLALILQSNQPARHTAGASSSTRDILSSFTVTKTLAQQPDATKQTFLNQAAADMGFERGKAVTPATVVQACLGQNANTIRSVTTHERDYYQHHTSELEEMSMAMKDYCYHTYTTDGSGAPMTMPMGEH